MQSTMETTSDELLLDTPEPKAVLDWSSDGRYLLYQALFPRTGMDLRILPPGGDGKSIPLLETAANEAAGQFSPDGRWLAYQSDESGTATHRRKTLTSSPCWAMGVLRRTTRP